MCSDESVGLTEEEREFLNTYFSEVKSNQKRYKYFKRLVSNLVEFFLGSGKNG